MFLSFESEIEVIKEDDELNNEVILITDNKKRKNTEQNLIVKSLKTCDNT
jgi:hypothetical protein